MIFTLFGYFYIPWLLGYALTLRYTPDGVVGLWYLAFPVLATAASDVGAYVVGSLFGQAQAGAAVEPRTRRSRARSAASAWRSSS